MQQVYVFIDSKHLEFKVLTLCNQCDLLKPIRIYKSNYRTVVLHYGRFKVKAYLHKKTKKSKHESWEALLHYLWTVDSVVYDSVEVSGLTLCLVVHICFNL